jgi:hypothetical protein
VTQFIPGRQAIYGRGLKSVSCMADVRKAGYEIRITIYSNPLEQIK